MGIRVFWTWLAEMSRSLTERQRGRVTDPESWDGQEADDWWAEQKRNREKLRGR